MSTSTDPNFHRTREQQFMRHVRSLLTDPRLRIDTLAGARPVTQFIAQVNHSDRALELKNLMIQMNRPDRDLQNRMPIGEWMDVTLSIRQFLMFQRAVGKLRVICASPSKAILAGEPPQPMSSKDIYKLLSELPPAFGRVPTTLLIMSTSGFTTDARELVDRRPDRMMILAEPNDAGGWRVYAPNQKKALADLLDPEADREKSQRIRALIDEQSTDLITSGISAERLAAKSLLPLQFVEGELKSYAREHPGLLAKRLDGRIVLFREGSSPLPTDVVGGISMPLIDRIRSLFARKGETEKKIALLSEQRTAFAQQLDRSYEEIGALEKRDAALRDEFKNASTEITKRRITGQLVQLRKDIERRQQLVSVLNQRVNVVATHLHNLELVRQDAQAKLPDSEEIAQDAAAAEEMLAELQASTELADSVGVSSTAGMSDEEQAMYEELEKQLHPPAEPEPVVQKVAPEKPRETAAPERVAPVEPPRVADERPKRAEPEAG